jgi:cellobiose-specific phosphotransferase system component IIB
MTRVAAYKASFSEKMWEKIEEMGSAPEKKEIGKILYPLGIRPKPEKSVSSKDPMKWEQVEKLYPELTRKAHEQYKKDEDVRCTKDPKKVRNPVTLENFSKADVIEEHVKQMPPQLTTKKYGKKNGGRTEQDKIVEKDRVFVLSEDKPKECENIPYAKEEEIEVLLEKNIEILERDAFIIGRQVETGYGKRIDLVAMDKDANIIIIELKKAKTEHYVLSQIFDYLSWVEKLKQEEINDRIANRLHNGKNHLGEFKSIEDKFTHRFKKKPTAWNSKQKLIIVGEQIDVQTKEQASSLAKRNVNVECVELNAYRNPQGTIVVVRYIPLQS